MRTPCFKIIFCDALVESADNLKDLPIVISESRLWIGIRSWQAGDVAIMFLMRRVERRGRLNVGVCCNRS